MNKLIIKSLWHFRKSHFSVFLGTLVSTAVLTGALIIGDSVRYSLRSQVDKRLGKTEYILNTGGRFVRQELAHEIAAKLSVKASPILMLRGISINTDANIRVNNTMVLGIDESLSQFSPQPLPPLNGDSAFISQNLAQRLNLKVGAEFLLRVEDANVIPLNTPFVPENKPSVAIRLTIKAIVDDNRLGSFSLQNNQTLPYNVFLPQTLLAEKLSLSGLVNVILFSGDKEKIISTSDYEKALASSVQLADAGLKADELEGLEKYELISNRIFIEKPIAKAIETLTIPKEKVLTYLVNSIHTGGKETPYSFVTAASSPMVPADLKTDEIVINDWLSKDLEVKVGDSVTLDYYVIGPLRTLTTKSKSFVIRHVVPLKETIADSSLMPAFPGMSDAGDCRDWNSGVPIDFKHIRDKDEKYWDDYRGTPKAYITLDAGLEIWSNPFGNYTAFRFDKEDVSSSDSLKSLLLKSLSYKDMGLSIVSARSEGLSAANNAVDFGELFLSLSFFIILAAVLLTMLLYVLQTEVRSRESAILSGLGYSKKKIILMRFAESSFVIISGGIAGAVAGIAYNYALLAGLNSVWHDAVRERMLQVYVQPTTLAVGALSGIFIALISIWFVTRRKLKQPVAVLVKGISEDVKVKITKQKWSNILALISIGGALILVCISLITASYENAGLFLCAGGLFLLGSTTWLSAYIGKPGKNQHLLSLQKLAVKNAGHRLSRSITIILVLAIGVFIVVLTGSYRKTYYGEEDQRKSGTGGYSLWAETTVPLSFNLNTPEGRKNLVVDNDKELDSAHFLQLHTLDGDDASCLNLNQVKRPRILGINPQEFNQRSAFSFVSLIDEATKKHPWLELTKTRGKVIPAFADQTVITYGLKKSIGDTLTYTAESGDTIKLRLIGGLDNSVFQGNILIADSLFVKYFPSAGSKVMLVESPKARQPEVMDILNKSFSDFGMTVTPTIQRLAEFNSVENTYLSVFMVLGGLGFLIGTLGLGIILYRNILERQHELALLLAMGYTRNQVFQLIMVEHIFLLLSGLACGVLSAFIGIFPSLVSPSFSIQGGFLIVLVISILAVGVVCVYVLTRLALRKNLMEGLKDE